MNELRIIRFCAEEVGRQYAHSKDPRGAATAVYWMVTAWWDALSWSRTARYGLTVATVEQWGRLIEPVTNALGFRSHNIFVGRRPCPPPRDVLSLVEHLLVHLHEITAADAYKEFEEIHPFADGNGRVGKILFNWLQGTLETPEMPPNVFGCANP